MPQHDGNVGQFFVWPYDTLLWCVSFYVVCAKLTEQQTTKVELKVTIDTLVLGYV